MMQGLLLMVDGVLMFAVLRFDQGNIDMDLRNDEWAYVDELISRQGF